MKRRLLIVLLAGALAGTVGCDLDDLEEINIDLGGWVAPVLYAAGYGYDRGPAAGYYEEVWVEEEYYEEDFYYEDVWVEDDWYRW